MKKLVVITQLKIRKRFYFPKTRLNTLYLFQSLNDFLWIYFSLFKTRASDLSPVITYTKRWILPLPPSLFHQHSIRKHVLALCFGGRGLEQAWPQRWEGRAAWSPWITPAWLGTWVRLAPRRRPSWHSFQLNFSLRDAFKKTLERENISSKELLLH